MNIFILDQNPIKAAQYHCDKHVVKMILEHTQIMSSSFYYLHGITKSIDLFKLESITRDYPRLDENGNVNLFKITHLNHPCSIWVRSSYSNFVWTLICTLSLCREYTYRYGKKHKTEKVVLWLLQNIKIYRDLFPVQELTPFALAMPEKYKEQDVVNSYRNYYIYEKKFATWKKRSIPDWYAIYSKTSS